MNLWRKLIDWWKSLPVDVTIKTESDYEREVRAGQPGQPAGKPMVEVKKTWRF